MIKVYTRQEFATTFEELKPGLGSPSSPLWQAEQSIQPDTCQYFICINPIHDTWEDIYDGFWTWCEDQLAGEVRCFSSNARDREEWWGFTNKDDILLWILRWGN